jgi:dTDP-3-amino-3,4,6-trideoxy-alpha-D-glucose transaminase
MTVPFLDLACANAELRSELDDTWNRVVGRGHFILGQECAAFEQEFAAYCGAAHAVGLSNGLDAIHLLLLAYGIGPGDEVIVPSMTFIATWLAVTYAGATPVAVEPDERTFNLDPSRLEAAITPRTKAILLVHLYGQPADVDAIRAVAERRGIRVIEDAAQAHGARCRGRRAGALADAAAFSFYPSKNLGALGDGGAITTDDAAIAERVRLLRNYGSRAKYANDVKGYNCRLDELQAALLRVKLRRLDAWNARRSAVAERYSAALAGIAGLTLPSQPPWAEPVWHLFVVRAARRDELQRHLAAQGIETLIHYPIPPHVSDAYAEARERLGPLPVAELLAASALSLPIGPHITGAQVEAVIEAVRGFFAARPGT